MHPTTTEPAPARRSQAILAVVIAFGVSSFGAAAQATATMPGAHRADERASRRPAPPPPPATDATLALVSASAGGQVARGLVCDVSADGSKVLFSSDSSNLVSGDAQFTQDLFLKDLNGNGVTRVVRNTSFCLALTPDANTVVYTLENLSVYPPIRVRNLSTGVETVVTPPTSTFPNVAGYEFAGVSDDGLRVAFIAQPTSSCRLYDCTALGPARMLMRDLATGQLVNLENQVRLTTTQGRAAGNARLSPDGQALAFSTYAPYPELGDNDGMSDVFSLNLATGALQWVNTDGAGNRIGALGFSGSGPAFGVQDFLANNGKVAFLSSVDTNGGAAGIYVKDLANGALTRVFGTQASVAGYRARVSFSDDLRKAAYVARTPGSTQTSVQSPAVVDLVTGAVLNAATLTNGTVGNGNTTVTVLLSRDGKAAVFDNNSTNLIGGPPPGGGAEQRVYRKLLP